MTSPKLVGVCAVPSCSKRCPLLLSPFCLDHSRLISRETRDLIIGARVDCDQTEFKAAIRAALKEIARAE